MKSNTPHLSVVIPAYNESKRIGDTLQEVTAFLNAQVYASEIIVVDDGSTDNLHSVVKKFAKKSPNIRCIRYEKNKGKGFAVREGMRNATGEYRLFMDADNSVSIEHIDTFIKEAQNGYDVVIGSILLPHMRNAVEKNGWHRVLLRRITKLIRTILINIDVYDTQRGFKLFSALAADRLFALHRVERFGFDIELLVLAQLLRFPIKELSVEWINPAGSKVTLLSYPHSLFELLTIRFNVLLRRYNM